VGEATPPSPSVFVHVLILSQYYAPEPIPKPAQLATSLAARGHQVSVLTGVPHYPTGKVYDGYRMGWLQRDAGAGVHVARAFEWPYHGRSLVGRSINYGSFALSASLAHWHLTRPDVMYVWHPPLSIGVASWLIGRQRRVPFVYDVQDIWPDEAVASGVLPQGPVARALGRLERFVYSRADHLLTATAAARENLIGKGVPLADVTAMPQWIDLAPFDIDTAAARAATRARHGWDDAFVVMYAGNIGIAQGLDTAIGAMARVPSTVGLRLVFVGDGADRERLRAEAITLGVGSRVEFIDFVPPDLIPTLYAGADALLLPLQQSAVFETTIPSKTMAYMAAGRPIVVAAAGAAADLVTRVGAGLVVPPQDADALAQAMGQLAAMPKAQRLAMGERGRRHAAATYDREAVVPLYEEILRSVAARSTDS
jgi:colanic acid biosynthesis glycosyl transferase WcaI